MKGAIITLVFVTMLLGVEAQSVTYSEIVPSSSFRYYTLLGTFKDSYLLSINDNKELRIKVFNEALRYKGDLKIPMPDKSRFNLLQNFIKDDKAHFIIEQYKRESSIYLQTYDLQTKKVDSIGLVQADEPSFLTAKVKVLNERYLLIHTVLDQAFLYKIFDLETKTWLEEKGRNGIPTNAALYQAFVKGNQLSLIFNASTSDGFSLETTQVTTIALNSKGTKDQLFDWKEEELVAVRFVQSLYDNEVKGFATYKSKEGAWNLARFDLEGSDMLTIDPLKIIDPLQADSLSKGSDEKLNIIGFVEASDNSFRVVLEEYREEIELVPVITNEGYIPTYITEKSSFFNFGNIYIPTVSEDNWELDSLLFLPKTQRESSIKSGYLSALSIPTSEYMVVMYNDTDVSEDVMVHYIDTKGDQTRFRLLVENVSTSPMRIKYGKHTDSNEVLFSRFIEGGLQIVRVDLTKP